MKAGFCELDITPQIGMEGPGDYMKNYVRAIHDPLKVRAAVIEDGADRVALVGVDTVAIQSAGAVARARKEIEERTGITGDHVLVGASHTHSGGPFESFGPADLEDAPELIRELVLNQSIAADPVYVEWVIGRIYTAVCEADRTKQDALLSVGSGHEDKVGFNRRIKMRNGRVYTHPGKGNPENLDYAGPIDPEVGVVSAWGLDGELLGCIVNYSLHGTTWGGSVSADWIYYMDETIKRALSPKAGVVFLNGACGDVTQVDNLSLETNREGEDMSRFTGARVGAEAVKVMVSEARGELKPVAAATKTLPLKRRPLSQERVAECRRIVEEGLKQEKTNTTEWIFAKEIVVLDYLMGRTPVVETEVQAIQVGPAVFLANPAEYFCQLGLDIKKGSPFPYTFVVELANGCIGYVPTEDAFLPSGGGYETVLTSYSNLEITAGRKLVGASLELARTLKPGAVPERQKAEPVREAWSYGVLGPDV